MAIQLKWVGEDELDKIAQVRHQGFGAAAKEIEHFREGVRADPRAKIGDFLLVESNGQPVGTTTSLSLNLWMRGARLPCQGVAFVATTKTSRRSGNGNQPGIATQMMNECIRVARERGEVVTALMPFRASYYEHFGYGLAEKRVDWTIPMSILPKGDSAGFRLFEKSDLPKLHATRQAECARGQCDMETSLDTLGMWAKEFENGWCMVYQPNPKGAILGYVFFTEERAADTKLLRVHDWCCGELSALPRLLYVLGSLKDQFSRVHFPLPGDIPLNLLLRESQIPHRQVDHPFATAAPCTRMQIRILDHQKVLEALHWPESAKGSVTVSVIECEGTTSSFKLQVEAGRGSVQPAKFAPQFSCADKTWASIVSGHLLASDALVWGLAEGERSTALLLDALGVGPQPYCQDYF